MCSMEKRLGKGRLLLLKVVKYGSGTFARLDPVKLEELGLKPGDKLLVEIREVI